MTNGNTSSQLKTCTTGSGLDLVLLHGWGTNGKAFDSLIPRLSDDFRVTTIDLPGFGENHQLLDVPVSIESICQQLAKVIPQGAVLCGWSLGGLIAQQFALLYPERISALVCVASSPHFMRERDWPGMKPEVLYAFTQQLKTDYDKTVERFIAIQAMGSSEAKQEVKLLRKKLLESPSPSHQALEEGLALLNHCDLRKDIGRISCPTLRIYGKKDSLVPISAVDFIHNLQPQSDNVILPEAAHAPFISHPDSCAQIMKRFAASLSIENPREPYSAYA